MSTQPFIWVMDSEVCDECDALLDYFGNCHNCDEYDEEDYPEYEYDEDYY